MLNGQKNWISYASVADHALVFAKTDPSAKHKGISAFVVEREWAGVTTQDTENKLGIWAGSTGELFFEDVEVPAENLVGEEGQGFEIAMYGLDQGRFTVAAGALGVIRACLERSVEYARERETFGQPIGKNQFVQDLIAQMVLDYETSKLLVMQAAWLKDKGVRNTRETSLAKWHATESAFKAAHNAIQVHGAYGYSAEYGIERYFRNARAPIIYEGTTQIHKMMQAEHALGWRNLNGRNGDVSPIASWAPALLGPVALARPQRSSSSCPRPRSRPPAARSRPAPRSPAWSSASPRPRCWKPGEHGTASAEGARRRRGTSTRWPSSRRAWASSSRTIASSTPSRCGSRKGWSTPEGLALGEQAGEIGATYGELAEIDCGHYSALVDNGPTATSAFYVLEDEVWGFGLLERGRSLPASETRASAGRARRVGRASSRSGKAPLPVDEVGLHPERPRALDIVERRVADHDRRRGLDPEQLEHGEEDGRARLHLAVDARGDPRVHVEPEVLDEGAQVAARVRDEPDPQPGLAQGREHRQHVLVELEVRRVEPAGRDRLGHLADTLPLTAHAADDVLREADPDLLVVLELGMVLQVLDRRRPRRLVAVGDRASARGAPRLRGSPPARAAGPAWPA